MGPHGQHKFIAPIIKTTPALIVPLKKMTGKVFKFASWLLILLGIISSVNCSWVIDKIFGSEPQPQPLLDTITCHGVELDRNELIFQSPTKGELLISGYSHEHINNIKPNSEGLDLNAILKQVYNAPLLYEAGRQTRIDMFYSDHSKFNINTSSVIDSKSYNSLVGDIKEKLSSSKSLFLIVRLSQVARPPIIRDFKFWMDSSDSDVREENTDEMPTWRTVEHDNDPSENVSNHEEEGESNALVRSNPLKKRSFPIIQCDFTKNKVLYLNEESIKMVKSWIAELEELIKQRKIDEANDLIRRAMRPFNLSGSIHDVHSLKQFFLRQKAAIHDRLAIENGEEPKIVENDSSDLESVKTDSDDSDDENESFDSDDENDTVDSGTTEQSTGLVKTESPAISENDSASNDQIVFLEEILTALNGLFSSDLTGDKKNAENEGIDIKPNINIKEEHNEGKNSKKPENVETSEINGKNIIDETILSHKESSFSWGPTFLAIGGFILVAVCVALVYSSNLKQEEESVEL